MVRWWGRGLLGACLVLGGAGCGPALPGQAVAPAPTVTPTWSPPTPTTVTLAALNPAQAAGLLGPSELFPALPALQSQVAYPLRAPAMFVPPLAATGPAAGLVVVPPGQSNPAFATSPVGYAFFARTNIRRRIDIQLARPGGFGIIAPLPGATRRPVTLGATSGELQAAPGLQSGDLPRLQLTWEDHDLAYLLLAAGYGEDELLLLAQTLVPVP